MGTLFDIFGRFFPPTGSSPPTPRPGPSRGAETTIRSYGQVVPVVYGTGVVKGFLAYAPEIPIPGNGAVATVSDGGVVSFAENLSKKEIVYAPAQYIFAQGPISAWRFFQRGTIKFNIGGSPDPKMALARTPGTMAQNDPELTLGNYATVADWAYASAKAVAHRVQFGHFVVLRTPYLILTDGRIPDLRAGLDGRCATGTLTYGGTNYAGAPPADMLQDMGENALVGMGLPAGTIITNVGTDGAAGSSFDRYMTARGWLLARVFDSAGEGTEAFEEVLAACDSTCLWDGVNLRVIPLCESAMGTFSPAATAYAFTEDEIVPPSEGEDPVEADRVPESDVANVIPVEFAPIYAPDGSRVTVESAEVARSLWGTLGTRRGGKVSLPCIPVESHAKAISQIAARRAAYNRTTFRWRASWRHIAIQPGDFVTLTHAKMGLSGTVAMVQKVDETSSGLFFEALEWFPGVTLDIQYTPQPPSGVGNNPLVPPDLGQVSQRNTVYYQNDAPATATSRKGDLWVEIDQHNRIWAFDGSGWYQIQDSWTADYNAGQALTLAGTKNSVFYQAGMPTGGTYKAGDIWFSIDTSTICGLGFGCPGTKDDDGSQRSPATHRGNYWAHTYNGSAWVSAETTALVIAAQIAAGAIVADKIAAKSVTIDKLTVGSFANLWPNPTSEVAPPTGADTSTAEWFGRTAVGGGSYAGDYCRELTSTTGADKSISHSVPAMPGESYYMEAMGYRVSGSGSASLYIAFRDKAGSVIGSFVQSNVQSAASWAKLKVTATAPANTVSVDFYLSSLANGTVTVSRFDSIVAKRLVEGDTGIVADSIATADYEYTGTKGASDEVATKGARLRNGTATDNSGSELPAIVVSKKGIKIGTKTIDQTWLTSGRVIAFSVSWNGTTLTCDSAVGIAWDGSIVGNIILKIATGAASKNYVITGHMRKTEGGVETLYVPTPLSPSTTDASGYASVYWSLVTNPASQLVLNGATRTWSAHFQIVLMDGTF